MWTRQELKAKGKAAFKRNYWKSVVVGLIAMAMTGAAAAGGQSSGGYQEVQTSLADAAAQSNLTMGVVFGILMGVIGFAMLLGVAVNVFVLKPIGVGANRFFVKNARQPAQLNEVFFAFKSGGYLKIVAARLLADLFILLWTLLLVVPGIIKAFEYAMVSYIMADRPETGPMEALRQSKQMMKGHKWNTFVLTLSFLGWELLNVLTFGLLGVFYVRPYREATFAELYLTLSQQ